VRVASDGLLARPGGSWTREKFDYVERYAHAFMAAMAVKRAEGKWRELVYIDLLAGPGKGIDHDSAREFLGSPLRALAVTPAFDRLFFRDLNATNIRTLRKRIPPTDVHRVDLAVGDCTVEAGRVVARLSERTLGLAFIDPEGFEVKLALFRALSKRPIDVLFLFPSAGIRRNLAQFMKQPHTGLDDLMGGRERRELPIAKLAAGKRVGSDEKSAFVRSLIPLFRARMKTLGFRYQDEADPIMTNEKNVGMYHLLFLSQHSAGLTIWKNIKKIGGDKQRPLF